MSGFIEGENRSQATLFPERLDDYIAEDSPVRVIDVFVDGAGSFGARLQDRGETHRTAWLPSRDAAQAIHLWVPQPRAVLAPPGARGAMSS